MSEERFNRLVVMIKRGGPAGAILEGEDQAAILWADAELSRLRSLATRWYLADGTWETLPEEEVIRRRKEAAGVLGRVADVDALEAFLDGDESRSMEELARKLVAFLSPKVTG